jgi:hypothetical protein
VENSNRKVGVATMINDFGAAACSGAVNDPTFVQNKKVEPLLSAGVQNFLKSSEGFAVRDSLAGVFDHFPAPRNVLAGENTETINP